MPGYLLEIATRPIPQLSGRVGILPAERRILRRGLLPRVKVRSGGTPEPAGETPTLPEIASPALECRAIFLRSLRLSFRSLRERSYVR